MATTQQLTNPRLNRERYFDFLNVLETINPVTRARMIIQKRNKYFKKN